MRIALALGLTLLVGACLVGRSVAPDPLPPRDETSQVGEWIVVRGQLVRIGAPVVKWFDEGGYSAYSSELRFPDEVPADPGWEPPSGPRYQPGRETDEPLARAVDQLVLHYDVCGTSRKCFKVLHDRRGLSCHFLLDVDGTLYQTLDLADTAWHARQANPRSIGVEIANLGAYPPGRYPLAHAGALVRGVVNGRELEMADFTPEQYATLAQLARALCEVFPGIAREVPRTGGGAVRTDALDEAEFERFRGILGHQHVSTDKSDPGPAFDWERFLDDVRAAP